MLIPNPISNMPPVEVRPRIISSVKKVAAYLANRVREAWKMKSGMADITTPAPNAEASSMAEKKSMNDLVKSRSGEPPVPSWIVPMIVSDPTQKRR